MMTIFGVDMSQLFGRLFQLHKTLQMDGFLTLLIMGVGCMIVPRFRNISLPSVKYAYLSFFLVHYNP
jgi:predicted tellurium resistance membrane protein TerC